MLRRRNLLKLALGAISLITAPHRKANSSEQPGDSPGVSLATALEKEDVFAYLQRTVGQFDAKRYKQILGSANPFKEGDQIVGVAAADDQSRTTARALLSATRVDQIEAHPPLEDQLYRLLTRSRDLLAAKKTKSLTLGELKQFLLREPEPQIQAIMPGLSSDVIGCLVKLMTDAELIEVGRKIFNPLPGSQIGAQGYLAPAFSRTRRPTT